MSWGTEHSLAGMLATEDNQARQGAGPDPVAEDDSEEHEKVGGQPTLLLSWASSTTRK